jgi:peptidoglycan hydrolase CwlO-like protein
MILKSLQKVFFLSIILFLFLRFNSLSFSQSETPSPTPKPDTSALQSQIKQYEQKISELKGQEKTLASQISIMDSQIKLTEYKIQATEEQITNLTLDIDTATKKINSLQKSLDNSINVLLNRIVATYEVGTIQPLQILLTSGNASDFLQRLNYLKLAQAHDKKLIYDTQQAKTDYANQKNIFENEKKQVESLRAQLEGYTLQLEEEKKSKQRLLADTKGSEANYQKLLAEARAEYEQIQGIIAGNGQENQIGQVSQGESIATVISGSSCNSTGTHLHFTVSSNGIAQNPFSFLKPVDYTNDSGGDDFNPSGNWDWPIDPPIDFNQGYGNTWFVRTYHAYSSHNGLDIAGSSLNVKAVKNGTLFQGSYTGSGGCRLRYVRVHHTDDGLDTFYLHINYIH